MAKEEKLILVSYKDVVTNVLKQKGIHSGIWMLYIEFGLAAVNAPIHDATQGVPDPDSNPLDSIMPTAILPIKKIGIQKTDQVSSIAVDAAVVNPKPKPPKPVKGRASGG